MPTLAELLRLQEDLPSEERAYIGYPQITNKRRPEGAITGFLQSAAGLPATPNKSVLNPDDVAYMQGQEYGELANIASIPASLIGGLPALLKNLPKKAVSEVPLDKIGMALEKRRINEYPTLVQEYMAIPESKGGKVINTDIARELSPEYVKNRTLSANVHEPASAFTKQYYAQKLAQPAPEGSTVVFTGGGTGAGKTSSMNSFAPIIENAEMIYDTNMNKLGSATKKIDQALDAGRKVDILYTYRDPVEALVEGSLKRAMNMKQELGTGRTVPLKEHIKTHIGSREVIEDLIKKYSDNPNVRIGVIDNRYGKNQQKVSSVDQLPKLDEKTVRKDLSDALEQQYKAGKIDKDIYESSK